MSTQYVGLREEVVREIQNTGIAVKHRKQGLSMPLQNIMSQHPIFIYCHQGSCKAMYDMHEVTYGKNELAIVMPGHVLKTLECTDDYVSSYMIVSIDLFSDIHTHIGADHDNFIKHPIITLSDERAKVLMQIGGILADIASHVGKDVHMHHQILRAQLFVGCEFIYKQYIEQERTKGLGMHTTLYYNFCDLVIKHYRESREVKFYADLLHLTPKYFAKILRQEMGVSPVEWIEKYIVTQAKRLIEIYPNRTLGQIAYMLGFSEPTSFYRYFKRVTGITAKQYRESLKGE